MITAGGPEAYGVVAVLDEIQQTGQTDGPDACGPVIEDPERGWLIWLVLPGTSAQWAPDRYGACLGRPARSPCHPCRKRTARRVLAAPHSRRPPDTACRVGGTVAHRN